MAAVELRGGIGTALRRNWLLALLVLLQSVLNIKTQHGLGLVLILAAQLGSAWLLYGKPGVYVAKIYCFALSVLALVLVLTEFKMDFIFNSMKSDLAWFFYISILGHICAAASMPFVLLKRKHAAALWRVPTTIFFTVIASFTTFVAFFVYYMLFTGKNL